MEIYRQTWAEVDLHAIGHNIEQLKGLLPKDAKMMGVIKADGYGHGSVQVANVLLEKGIDHLMVALLEEAVLLREAGIQVPILVIGRVRPVYAQVAAAHDITLTVFDKEWVEALREIDLSKTLAVHLEFETGMNRTGIETEKDLYNVVAAIKSTEKVKITGAYTHFATADEVESVLYEHQQAHYHHMLRELKKVYPYPIIAHMGNSAAGIQYAREMLDYTRFGISIYGLYASPAIKSLGIIELKQAMSLYSELMQVKKVRAGAGVSYGATYKPTVDEWIGTIPIGYADGWSRDLQGFHVLIEGEKCPIVGRICMDSMMVKLNKVYEVGTRVTLIGKDNGASITIDDVATHLGTICYEIPTMLTSRIPRVYR